ncbi:conserved hypothetical protein [Talaromyces stipitatus ATCC 10500]|uniref:Capsule polysaccharide biosynthesis protein n=1 Tax=Talaromyces stipitatus (strain ATCC 10500 / CBS 375.48 / QM 6759 / NRRL 1006) TaxID=441959 RepID=B8MI12_TALSN|nr:uncharacterized protein TSTA_022280 [Talaromyces stipitatus ATCC 10500]EED17174.1 conserved hypothetical protein [Talaromyces stipitatus ATCC 10500]
MSSIFPYRFYSRRVKLLLRLRPGRLFWLLLAILNVKCLPLVWHYRFFIPIIAAALRKPITQSMVQRQKDEVPLVFLPIITKTKVPILEGDFNLHKSNSTYFTDLDSSRSILLSFLVFHGMSKTHKELAAEGKNGVMTVMLGSTYTHFKREIPTGHPYEVWSRVLTWDHKWLYIVTHFVRKDKILPRASITEIINSRTTETANEKVLRKHCGMIKALSQGELESSVFATSISKCVFKKGRMTVSPERVLSASELLSNTTSDASPIDLTAPHDSLRMEANELLQNRITAQSSNGELAAEIEEQRAKGMRFTYLLSELEDLQGCLLKDQEVSNGVITLGTFSELGHSVFTEPVDTNARTVVEQEFYYFPNNFDLRPQLSVDTSNLWW